MRSLSVFLLISALVSAQGLTSNDPALTLSPFASGLPSAGSFTTAAVDRFGMLYVVTTPPGSSPSFSQVLRIDPSGNFLGMSTFGSPIGQLGYHPINGRVFMMEHVNFGTSIQTLFCRLETNGGVSFQTVLPFKVEGFTVADNGDMFLGGDGPMGQGIYWTTMNSLSFLLFVHAGVGGNTRLQSLANGDLLVADGGDVHRLTPNVPGTTLVHSAAAVQGSGAITSFGRNPFNPHGVDTLVMEQDLGGAGESATLRLMGALSSSLVDEAYVGPQGARLVASGHFRDAYIVHHNGVTADVSKLVETPQHGQVGSLLMAAASGSITVDLYGLPNAVFILGVAYAPLAPPPALLPGFGMIDIDPTHAAYLAAIDGAGVFGPPSPAGILPASGHFHSVSFVGSLGAPFPFVGQALVADPQAPNGLFMVSTKANFTLN